MVKERGFTLSGAKQELKDRKAWYRKRDDMIKVLRGVRKGLTDLRNELSE
ncbi:MAG: hypothetical protein AAFU60_18890 [Bacteroidota bacterium]